MKICLEPTKLSIENWKCPKMHETSGGLWCVIVSFLPSLSLFLVPGAYALRLFLFIVPFACSLEWFPSLVLFLASLQLAPHFANFACFPSFVILVCFISTPHQLTLFLLHCSFCFVRSFSNAKFKFWSGWYSFSVFRLFSSLQTSHRAETLTTRVYRARR